MEVTLAKLNAVGGIVAAVIAGLGVVVAGSLWLTGINADVEGLETDVDELKGGQATIIEKIDDSNRHWRDTVTAINSRTDDVNERIDDAIQLTYIASLKEHVPD